MRLTASRVIVFSLGVLLGVLVLTLALTVSDKTSKKSSNFEPESLAKAVIEVCKDDQYRPACYDRELPKYMDEGYSMEEVFMVTRRVQQEDDEYQYCHVLGHYLSQKETAKDPSLWKDVFARAPRGICSNGAIHGAFQERFNADALPDATVDELKAELLAICDARENWKPTGLERGSCLHALGHLTMYATGGDIDRSLTLCDELVPPQGGYRGETQLCYDGAFMQIFQPLESEDIALVAHYGIDNFTKAKALCSSYTDEQFGSCTSESWAMADNAVRDPERILSICEPLFATGGQQLTRCIDNIFYIAAAQFNLRVPEINDFCSNVESPYHYTCYESATSRLIEVDWDNIDKSVDLCTQAAAVQADVACFNKLVAMSTFTFDVQSEHFRRLCDSMPEPYKAKCFAKS